MKRVILLLLSVLLAVVTYGQSDDNQSKEVYVLVTVYSSTTKVEAKIDFGDGTKAMYFADEKGSRRKFVSFFEPINILVKDGWEMEHYIPFVAGSCQAIMKKKVNQETDAKEGMKLIKE